MLLYTFYLFISNISSHMSYFIIGYICLILNTTSNPETIANVGYPKLPEKKTVSPRAKKHTKMAAAKPYLR